MLRIERAALVMALVAASACAPYPRPGRVVVVREPPALLVERYDNRPGPDYVWVAGRWRWDGGDYQWAPGSWSRAPRGFREWVPGHWQRYRGGWMYHEGHWR